MYRNNADYIHRTRLHFEFENAILETKDTEVLSNYRTIRKLRNEAFGHPSAKKGRKGLLSRHFFDIIDNKKQVLKLINWECSGDIKSEHFILKVIAHTGQISNYFVEHLRILALAE